MLTKYKYIYFDLDGTIIDSSVGVVNSVIYTLNRFNLEDYSVGSIKQAVIGPPLYQGLQNLTGIKDDSFLNEMITVFREKYSTKGVFQNSLFPNIKNTLVKLSELGCTMEILTSKPTKFAEQIVKQHGIEIFFSKIDGAGDTDKKSLKSNKLGFSTLSNQDISIMIGDRVEDIVAGRGNNVDTVAVTYGFDDLELLKKQKPTYCIDSIIDLVDIIKIN